MMVSAGDHLYKPVAPCEAGLHSGKLSYVNVISMSDARISCAQALEALHALNHQQKLI